MPPVTRPTWARRPSRRCGRRPRSNHGGADHVRPRLFVGLVASEPRVPSVQIASIAVGFARAAGVFIGGPLTGGAVNPARALGPMIVSGQLDDFWLYIIGPVIGGLLGAFVAAYVLRAFQQEQED